MIKLCVIAVTTGICFTGFFGKACEMLETKMSRTTLLVNSSATNWKATQSNSFPGLNIVKCAGGFLQLSLGATLPHPQFFNGITFTGLDYQRAPMCSLKSESNTKSIEFSGLVKSNQSLARECVGLIVESPDMSRVNLQPSPDCQIVNHNTNSSLVTLKGDNCILKPTPSGYKTQVTILPSCHSELKKSFLREIDLTLNVQFAAELNSKASPDGLAAKPIRVTFESDSLSNSSNIKASSLFEAQVQLSQFSLRGTTETGLIAESTYLIDRSQSLQQEQYQIPFVVKNELYLLKQNSESTHLGSWYNASIIPAGWTGLDGSATFNRLFEIQRRGQLNQATKLIKTHDKIVLISRLENPNVSTKKWARTIADSRKRSPEKKSAESTVGSFDDKDITQIPTLENLIGIDQFEELPGLSLLNSAQKAKVKELFNWPVRYLNICINSKCMAAENFIEGLEIQTVFNVEDADFELKLVQERQLTKLNGKTESLRISSSNPSIECL